MEAVLDHEATVPLLLVALSLQVVVALGGVALSRFKPNIARSALITQILLAAFFMLVVLTPALQADANTSDSPRLFNLAVFLGLLGLLKLLGRFEE
jgi:uncharacterized membrane protein